MVSEHVTRAYKIFKVIAIISGSLVFKAVLIGIINCGITGRTLAPPFSSISNTPWTARNLYGSIFSLMPSKKIGR
jgi:hypothetical protein